MKKKKNGLVNWKNIACKSIIIFDSQLFSFLAIIFFLKLLFSCCIFADVSLKTTILCHSLLKTKLNIDIKKSTNSSLYNRCKFLPDQ